jgi:hypothetical protein
MLSVVLTDSNAQHHSESPGLLHGPQLAFACALIRHQERHFSIPLVVEQHQHSLSRKLLDQP